LSISNEEIWKVPLRKEKKNDEESWEQALEESGRQQPACFVQGRVMES
jgi:hypothetical protein